eukprot:5890329-Prymnesium_polylepis.1
MREAGASCDTPPVRRGGCANKTCHPPRRDLATIASAHSPGRRVRAGDEGAPPLSLTRRTRRRPTRGPRTGRTSQRAPEATRAGRVERHTRLGQSERGAAAVSVGAARRGGVGFGFGVGAPRAHALTTAHTRPLRVKVAPLVRARLEPRRRWHARGACRWMRRCSSSSSQMCSCSCVRP